MKRLYLETNYIVGQAFAQDPAAATIIAEAAKVGAEICLPSFCVQEALTAIQLRRKSTNQFERTLQQKVEELRDDQSSTAVALKTSINMLIPQNGRLRDERERRITTVVASLASIRLIELEHVTAMAALSTPLASGAADNLILHVVSKDAQGHQGSDMALFTMNTRDFAKSTALEALTANNIRLLTTSSEVIEWLRR